MYMLFLSTEFSFVFNYINDKNYFEVVFMKDRVAIKEVNNGKR